MTSRPSETAVAPAGSPDLVRMSPRGLDELDHATWVHRTPPLRALGFDFAVRTSNQVVGRYLEELLRAFESDGGSRHVYSLLERPWDPAERYVLYRDREHISTTRFASTVLGHLLGDVNRRVVEHTPGLLLFHASAVEHRGVAVLLPAPMASGKTTLAAGLLLRGLRYVTDETVAIDPETLSIHPYPKPLGIEPGSWDVLQEVRPATDPSLAGFAEGAWYVPPQAIREDAVAPACVPGFVITPRYERGAATELTPMARSEALITLAENSFNVPEFGVRRSMEILARVVRRSRCFRLTVGDLDSACATVLEAIDDGDGT